MEWGCMQALIDFDGWRKWKDFSAQEVQPDAAPKKSGGGGGKGKGKKSRLGAAREAVATSATIREEE
jgi:osomolarity two-component system response regulator SSK1